MSVARRDALNKSAEPKKPPVQIVTPEKKKKDVQAVEVGLYLLQRV